LAPEHKAGGLTMRRVNSNNTFGKIKSQGATEYLLVLAVVLVVVAAVISFLFATRPAAISITGSAEKSDDSIVFTPSNSMAPDSISTAD
jgi:hypothetical protein